MWRYPLTSHSCATVLKNATTLQSINFTTDWCKDNLYASPPSCSICVENAMQQLTTYCYRLLTHLSPDRPRNKSIILTLLFWHTWTIDTCIILDKMISVEWEISGSTNPTLQHTGSNEINVSNVGIYWCSTVWK